MTSPERKYIKLRMYNGDHHQTYVELADHPHELTDCVRRTVRVQNLIHDGPGIAIDFDESNRAIGIEILYAYEDDDDE
jgi:hypothetical protein